MKFPFKTHTETLLPIVLAIVLPGLSLLVNDNEQVLSETGVGNIFFVWTVTSILLYALWQAIWKTWEIPDSRIRALTLFAIATASGLTVGTLPGLFSASTEALNTSFLFRIVIASVLFVTIQSALRAQQAMAKLQLEKEQILTQNYKVQLQAIRARIDPHFLFNSLNTLRSMVRQNHSNSEQFVIHLSDFYRSTLKHNENSTLPLGEELKVLDAYLYVMKSRSGEAVEFEFSITQEARAKHIPSLALQIVVENCFKHNSMTTKNPLRIELRTGKEGNSILVKNNRQARMKEAEPSGRGLEMIQLRYELLNIAEGVRVKETTASYQIELKLIEP